MSNKRTDVRSARVAAKDSLRDAQRVVFLNFGNCEAEMQLI